MSKLLQEDIIQAISEGQNFMGSKFCIYFSFVFSKLPPLCSPSPLGEAEGGREGGADKNFCLPSDQPTILFYGDGNCSESVCKVTLAYINHHRLEKLSSSDSNKIGATAMLLQTLFCYDIQISNQV